MSLRTTSVASTPLRLRAIAANVTHSRAVITLGPLHTVPRQMTYTAARVASLAAAVTAVTSATVASITASTLRACTSDMPNLSATVAFRTGGGSEPGAVATIVLSAITGNMTFQTTFVA